MPLVTLADVLQPALRDGYAVAGLVTLGWEDMLAYVAAAEAEQLPIILQAGPSCRAHTPLPVLGCMFRTLADRASVPIVAHLDHGSSLEECQQAIDSGFSSVMFDGSRLPLAENIAQTKAVVQRAHKSGVSCEGELGFVGYSGGQASNGTDPGEAAHFAAETGVDALAVSVGNLHLQQHSGAELDEDLIRAIERATPVPLVIHGGSGVPHAQRRKLARHSHIVKFNIGTELRQIFGSSLRAALAANPQSFDRLEILKQTQPPLVSATRQILRDLSGK